MRPARWSRMTRPAALHAMASAVTLRARVRSRPRGDVEEGLDHAVAGVVDQGVDAAPAGSDAGDGFLGGASRVRSRAMGSASAPAASIRRAVSARAVALMSAMPTAQPRAASWSATSRPRPPAAPVTSARGRRARGVGGGQRGALPELVLEVLLPVPYGGCQPGRAELRREGDEGHGSRNAAARGVPVPLLVARRTPTQESSGPGRPSGRRGRWRPMSTTTLRRT